MLKLTFLTQNQNYNNFLDNFLWRYNQICIYETQTKWSPGSPSSTSGNFCREQIGRSDLESWLLV